MLPNLLEQGGSDPWPGYKYSGTLRPVYPLSPRRTVPAHIQKPDYADTGIPLSEQNIRSSSVIEALPKEDIDVLRKVCKVHTPGLSQSIFTGPFVSKL